MIQESLVEYINAQMKAGMSRDALKSTLVGAGWAPADVEDTLKKVEAPKTAQPMPASTPVSMSPLGATAKPAEPAAARVVTPAGGPNPAPQTIKVSDLVSSSTVGPATASASKFGTSRSPMTGPAAKTSDGSQPTSFSASSPAKPRGSHGALITEVVLGVIALAAIAFGGFLYTQNGSLTSQLSSLKGQSSGVNSQLSSLQAQVAASTTALTAQVSSLQGEAQELQTELSFYVAPSSTVPGATSTATVEGVVYSGKTSYVITAAYGAKVAVANSKDAAVVAALAPLMAGTSTPATTAQFTGTYVPGTDSMTLTAVNGSAIQ